MFSKLIEVVLFVLHSCRNALFHCLLFNSSLNSPEFKFELNMFESISKENAKLFSLSPSLFSPPGPIPLLSFIFLSFPRSPNCRPVSCPGLTRAPPLLPHLAARRGPPVRVVLDLVTDRDSVPSPDRARRATDFGRGPHAKALLRPIKAAARTLEP